MIKSPKFLLIGLALIIFFGGGLLWQFRGDKTSFFTPPQSQIPSASQSVKLSFQRNTTSSSKNNQLKILLDADASTELNGLQFVLQYDPTMVSFIDAKPGPYFESPMVFAKKADDTSKVVIFALGSLTPRLGKGTVAELTFQPKKAGSAVFSLEPKSKASPQNGDPISVLLPSNQTYKVTNE